MLRALSPEVIHLGVESMSYKCSGQRNARRPKTACFPKTAGTRLPEIDCPPLELARHGKPLSRSVWLWSIVVVGEEEDGDFLVRNVADVHSAMGQSARLIPVNLAW